MIKLIPVCLLISVLAGGTAFAKNLGQMDHEKQPQNLISASEFSNFVNSSSEAVVNSGSESAVTLPDPAARHGGRGYGHHRGGYHRGYWGSYYPSYYPSYYYPYYGYSSYYPYYYGYGRHHHHRRHLDGVTANASTSVDNNQSTGVDRAQTVVACFAADASGTWYANADVATNVTATQELANRECLASGGSCSQNLGCAIAYQ